MEQAKRFVICVDNSDYPASLEVRKIYPVLEEPQAERHGYVRVVDESGEDYLFPSRCFLPIELPQPVRKALFAA